MQIKAHYASVVRNRGGDLARRTRTVYVLCLATPSFFLALFFSLYPHFFSVTGQHEIAARIADTSRYSHISSRKWCRYK